MTEDTILVLNEGWGKIASAFFGSYVGVAIHSVVSQQSVRKLASNSKFAKIVNAQCDKVYKDAVRNNRNLTKDVPSEYGKFSKSWFAMDFSDMLVGYSDADYQLFNLKYPVVIVYDYDSIIRLYLILYDKQAGKLRKFTVPAPTHFSEYD